MGGDINPVKILMVGPSPDGLGGISRVVRIWENGHIFSKHNIVYFPSVTDNIKSKYLYLLKSWLLYLFSLFRPHSLIYIHSSSYKSFYRKSIFIFPAVIFTKKVILHIHNSTFADFIKTGNPLLVRYIRFLLKRIFAFVVLTNEMQQKMHMLFPQKKIWILPNPVDIDALRNRNYVSRKKDRILFLGWFIPAKGIYELVDAVEILLTKGCTVFVDFYGTKQVDELKKYIESKNLQKYITVHGWINDIKKIDILYRSTILVLPSYTEGLPNVILEAMATRTPIIATNVGGLKELLYHGKNALIVKPKDSIDLSEKISFLLANPDIQNKLAEKAYHDVKEKYDISKIKQKFDYIISEITVSDLNET